MPRVAPLKTARSAPAGRNGRPTQQALKSAQTRLQLIEATIRCLIQFGYANTTTPRVAVEAGLSRGAMLQKNIRCQQSRSIKQCFNQSCFNQFSLNESRSISVRVTKCREPEVAPHFPVRFACPPPARVSGDHPDNRC